MTNGRLHLNILSNRRLISYYSIVYSLCIASQDELRGGVGCPIPGINPSPTSWLTDSLLRFWIFHPVVNSLPPSAPLLLLLLLLQQEIRYDSIGSGAFVQHPATVNLNGFHGRKLMDIHPSWLLLVAVAGWSITRRLAGVELVSFFLLLLLVEPLISFLGPRHRMSATSCVSSHFASLPPPPRTQRNIIIVIIIVIIPPVMMASVNGNAGWDSRLRSHCIDRVAVVGFWPIDTGGHLAAPISFN